MSQVIITISDDKLREVRVKAPESAAMQITKKAVALGRELASIQPPRAREEKEAMDWQIKLDQDGNLCEDTKKEPSMAYYLPEAQINIIGLAGGREAIREALREGRMVPMKRQDPFTAWCAAAGLSKDEMMMSSDCNVEPHAVHWTGQKISADLFHDLQAAPEVGQILREYGESLPDKEERRAFFTEYRAACVFKEDLFNWIRDQSQVTKEDSASEKWLKLERYYRSMEAGMIYFVPENLTDQVPLAMRVKFGKADQTIIAWEKRGYRLKKICIEKDRDGKVFWHWY